MLFADILGALPVWLCVVLCMYCTPDCVADCTPQGRIIHLELTPVLNIGKGVTIYDIEHNFSVELNKWQCVAPQYCAAVALPS